MSAELAAWADELATPDGDTAMLGTGRRASRFEALLWSAARNPDDPYVVTALLAASRTADVVRLGRALASGTAIVAQSSAASPNAGARADVATLGCAVVAALVGPEPSPPLPAVLDVAASLMLIHPPVPVGVPRVRLARAGHPAASGWLAARSVAAGLTGMPDAVATTIATVAGVAASSVDLPPDVAGLLAAVT